MWKKKSNENAPWAQSQHTVRILGKHLRCPLSAFWSLFSSLYWKLLQIMAAFYLPPTSTDVPFCSQSLLRPWKKCSLLSHSGPGEHDLDKDVWRTSSQHIHKQCQEPHLPTSVFRGAPPHKALELCRWVLPEGDTEQCDQVQKSHPLSPSSHMVIWAQSHFLSLGITL